MSRYVGLYKHAYTADLYASFHACHNLTTDQNDINPGWAQITGNLQCSVQFNRLKQPISRPGW